MIADQFLGDLVIAHISNLIWLLFDFSKKSSITWHFSNYFCKYYVRMQFDEILRNVSETEIFTYSLLNIPKKWWA